MLSLQRPLVHLAKQQHFLKTMRGEISLVRARLTNAKNPEHIRKLMHEERRLETEIEKTKDLIKSVLMTIERFKIQQTVFPPNGGRLRPLTPEEATKIQLQIRDKYVPKERHFVSYQGSDDPDEFPALPVRNPEVKKDDSYFPSNETIVKTAKIVAGVALAIGIGYFAYRLFAGGSSNQSVSIQPKTIVLSDNERAFLKAEDMVKDWDSHLSSTRDSVHVKKDVIIEALTKKKHGETLAQLLKNGVISKREWYYILAKGKLTDWGISADKIGNPPSSVLEGAPMTRATA